MKARGLVARILPHPGLSAMLVVVWLLLSNGVTPGGMLLAAGMGVLIPLLTRRYWPDRPKVRFGRALLAYLGLVLFDIAVANVRVAGLILFRRNAQLRSAWMVVPLDLRAPEAVAALAGTITLTPGTVSCDLSDDGRALLVHGLDVADAEAAVQAIKRRYEARLKEIFP